jgi:hypothetical protein
MARPGDGIAASAGGLGHLRASHADREQAVSVLKAAFVQGRLAKDEFDLRIGQVLVSRTYAELRALTADIPAGLTADQPFSEPALRSVNKKAVMVGAGVTAMFTGMSAVVMAATGGNTGPVGAVFFLLPIAAILVTVLLAFHAWLDRRADRQSSHGLPPGAGGEGSRRPVSTELAGQLPEVDHDPRHTAEAAPIRRSRPASPSWPPIRWRPLGRRYALGYPGH